MSRSIHFISKSIPGYGPPDSGTYFPCSGASGRRAVNGFICPFRCEQNKFSKTNTASLKYISRKMSSASLMCNASSSSSHRRNPDFSRHNRQGYSRNRNRQNEDRDNFDTTFEDSEVFASKNGPLSSVSGTPKFQATATPGPREKEIVELFRKVQAQLRERAALKEERKTEDPGGKGKESETVDSLLKLLRKHSVQQGKRGGNSSSSKEFVIDQPESSGLFSEQSDVNANSNLDLDSSMKQGEKETEIPLRPASRPRSTFQKRSPVPQVKFQPIYSNEERADSVLQSTDLDGKEKKTTIEPEIDSFSKLKIVESENESDAESAFLEEEVLDELSEDEASEIFTDSEVEEENLVEASDFSGMKLPELRALAKSRGIKGFSKLKKRELIELLSGG